MKRLAALAIVLLIPFSSFAENSDDYNIRFTPIGLGLIFGAIGVGMDFKIDPNWTIGPQAMYAHFSISSSDDFSSDYDFTTWGIGARANWFRNGTFTSGLYVGPSLSYLSIKATTTDNTGDALSATASPILLGCVVGYAWFWDSFNMMLGGGASVGLGDTTVTVKDSSGDSVSPSTNIAGLDLEFTLGWTF